MTKKTQTKIIAHRASSGLWIQNSRHAVEQTVELFRQDKSKFHGIEVDIVLTKDNIPVLSHDPWVHKELASHIDGNDFGEVFIKDISLKELQSNYRYGGIKDKEFENAVVKTESIMSLVEFLDVVKQAPELIVFLDVKIQHPYTASSQAYAKAIFTHWEQANMSNPLYIEGPNTEAISAYQQYAQSPFTAVLSYPPFFVGENWIQEGAIAAFKAHAKPDKPLKKAQQANADAVVCPTIVAGDAAIAHLQREGKEVIVFTPNSPEDIHDAYCSGVDMLITDFPNLGACSPN